MNSETKRFGVGIRGAGQVAYEHANAVENNPHLFLKAVCSRSLESARRLAAQYGSQTTVYETYEAMLADEAVDIVSVCMPNHLHARDAVRAFEAKKHLILEKPAAINDEELQELRQAAEKAETRSVVSFVLRWHPMVSNLKAVLDQKAIGDIYYVEADYWHGIQKTFASYNWIRKKEYACDSMETVLAIERSAVTGKPVKVGRGCCCGSTPGHAAAVNPALKDM